MRVSLILKQLASENSETIALRVVLAFSRYFERRGGFCVDKGFCSSVRTSSTALAVTQAILLSPEIPRDASRDGDTQLNDAGRRLFSVTIHVSVVQVQKTYTLSELQSGTTYDIRVRAHNNAGFSVAEYRITTLQSHTSSTMPAFEIDQYIPQHSSVYSDLKLIIPLILCSLAIITAAGAVFYCFRKR